MKKPFLDEDFLLQTESARQLYHEFAKAMPIIDYHCHLPPDQMAADRQFDNLTQIWLYGDHYKWRAMRANGVDESYCTGGQPDAAKFQKWAETVPYTLRNPLYHWTHLELKRYFGVTELLDGRSAGRIYEACSEQLRTPDFSVRNLLRKMNVRVVCTTDDPADSLEHHITLFNANIEIDVLPTFRADKAMAVDDPATYNQYLTRLEAAANVSISTFDDLVTALRQRHDYFADMGCKLSDHGLEQVYADDYTEAGIRAIFAKIRGGNALNPVENSQFKSAMLVFLAEMDAEKGWTQQFHLGALRNNNARMLQQLGPDTGWDSMGDFSQGRSLSAFLSRLDAQNKLTKTILYNLNPSDNELMATMAGNFNDGTVAGKVQFGSGWWFLDQKDGMEKQMNALSNMGLISRFVGMLTDSRSFLSYPRHEYFRRVLCNLFGNDIENGELPDDMAWIGQLVQNICYNNANTYFGFETNSRTAVPREAGPRKAGKIVTFGEVMMRLSPPLNYRLVQATDLEITYGGGEANVSASLARLGLSAEHVTCFPDNELGRAAAGHLQQYGLSLANTVFTGDRLGLYFLESGASVRASKLVYDRAGSAFAQLHPNWFDWETILDGAAWFHWTGITPAVSASAAAACAEAIQTARRLGVTVSADVNYRRNLWQYGQTAQDVMPDLVAGCDVVVCAENDAEDLFGIPADLGHRNSFANMSARLMERFPTIQQVITTRRETLSASHNQLHGLLCDQNSDMQQTPTYDVVPIVDRIGGGDAFMAGFIYGSLHYATAGEALSCGVAASVLKHSIHGDINLATVSEIEAVMAGNTSGRLLR